jgi:hypothetical protein
MVAIAPATVVAAAALAWKVISVGHPIIICISDNSQDSSLGRASILGRSKRTHHFTELELTQRPTEWEQD